MDVAFDMPITLRRLPGGPSAAVTPLAWESGLLRIRLADDMSFVPSDSEAVELTQDTTVLLGEVVALSGMDILVRVSHRYDRRQAEENAAQWRSGRSRSTSA